MICNLLQLYFKANIFDLTHLKYNRLLNLRGQAKKWLQLGSDKMAGMTFQVARCLREEQKKKTHSSSHGNLEGKWVGFLPRPGPGPRADAVTRDKAAIFQ